jgi:hypothetical protein
MNDVGSRGPLPAGTTIGHGFAKVRSMRRSRRSNKCPKCQAQIEPAYRFCLVCGAVLNSEAEPAPPPSVAAKPEAKGKRGQKKPADKSISQMISSDFTYIQQPAEVAAVPKSRSSGGLRVILMLLILVTGAIGGMIYWNENQTNAEDKITWEQISDLDYAGVWDRISNSSGTAGAYPKGVPSRAVESTVEGIAEDGTISVSIDGEMRTVRLAGIPQNFAEQCFGDKALARIGRVLAEDAVVYVAHDGPGKISSSPESVPAVYIWREDPKSGKVRYINEELIASGETDLVAVTLATSDPGVDLTRALERAKAKQRGRFGPAVC